VSSKCTKSSWSARAPLPSDLLRETCNIVTFWPGDCACCQALVEPIEVLPTDPRIYQEPDKRVGCAVGSG
jgi:hypothetical protein